MLIALVAIALLIAAVAAIYLLLKSMGQDGVEIAAPGSCRSGRCGVRDTAGAAAGCRQQEVRLDETGEIDEAAKLDREDALAEQPDKRPG
ncbi:MAG: hypothetical protein NDI91_11645 [Sulfuritalea sp.]|nr:hypothetical protein [Sulfuritalea sp.]